MSAYDEAREPEPELTADFPRSLPGGTLDDSTYSAIEDALDKADAPMTDNGRWLSLVERVTALAQSATARAERVEKALQWVREVYPGTTRDPSRGAVVEMTWDEFNEMREAIGLKPVQPPARRQRPKQATPLSDGGADG